MAKFTKSTQKKVAAPSDKSLEKKAGGIQKVNKKNGHNKPAVAPAALVKAEIVAAAKATKLAKSAKGASAKPTANGVARKCFL